MKQMETILDIRDLCVEFKTAEGTVKAVNNLSYTLHKGEKLGIVGESGSGKSVSSLGIMQLIPNPPGQITNGSILYRDKDLVTAEEKEMQKIRGNEIFVDRKVNSKSITRSSVEMVFRKLQERRQGGEEFPLPVQGPKKLGVFGASYLYPVLKRLELVRPE